MDTVEGVQGSETLLKPLLQSLKSAVAVADLEDWSIIFENARFFQWFTPSGEIDETLEQRLPDLDPLRARTRLEKGRAFRFETEVKEGARSISVAVEMRAETLGDREVLLIECANISKQKEGCIDNFLRKLPKQFRK